MRVNPLSPSASPSPFPSISSHYSFTSPSTSLYLFVSLSFSLVSLLLPFPPLHKYTPTPLLRITRLTLLSYQGLEFSDPLSSHIVQACARIAGIIGDDYKPYVDLYIPPLLASISKGISVQVAKEGDFFQPQGPGGQGNGEKEPDVFNVYQRGVGNVQVIFNTHEITEREMGCRCLYQYITDIHQSLWHQSLPIVKAVCPLLSSTVHKSEDLFVTTGAIVVDALKMFLFYSPSSYLIPPYTASLLPSTPPCTYSSSPSVSAPSYTVSCAGEMACIEAVREMMMTSLSHLHKALQQLQYCCASTSTNTSTDLKLAVAIAGTINEVLTAKLNSTLSISHSNKWPHCIPSDVMFELMITVRDMSILFIQKRYIDIIPTSDEDEEVKHTHTHFPRQIELSSLFEKIFISVESCWNEFMYVCMYLCMYVCVCGSDMSYA